MQNVHKLFFSMLLFSASTSFCIEDVTVAIADETIKKIIETITPSSALQNAMIVSAFVHVYPVAKDLWQGLVPTTEQKAITLAANEKVEFLQARAEFRNCLFTSKQNSAKGSFGGPLGCNELAHAFVKCGGKSEAIQMIDDFNDLGK